MSRYLASYRFPGDADALLPAYDQLVAGFPPGMLTLHVCVAAADGLTVLDACPSEADFEAFVASGRLQAGARAVGLPDPVIEGLGPIHHAVVAEGVGR